MNRTLETIGRVLMGTAILLLMPATAALAECGSQTDLPAGSHRQSCNACATSGGDLTASCTKINNQPNSSTLFKYPSCRSGLSGMDGFLTCDKGDSAPPGGGYAASCRNIDVEKGTLYGTCRNVNGDWKETSLPLGRCNYQIYNGDGVLQCTLPHGTYQRSCRNARVVNSTLIADCRNDGGAYVVTTAAAACNRDLANINGSLRCQ